MRVGSGSVCDEVVEAGCYDGNMSLEIPKIIHSVWVGGKPLSPLAEQCLASWREHLPEYELRLWNEDNSPLEHHYAQAMYQKGKWAFVSDYIRFWALHEYGGIYLDTDMEVLRSLESLRTEYSHGFVGKSSWGDIESSLIALPPRSEVAERALQFYDSDTRYSIEDTSPKVLADVLRASATQPTIFDHTYFHPCNEGEACDKELLKHAYARHHWDESWVPFRRARKLARRLGIMPLLKKLRQ